MQRHALPEAHTSHEVVAHLLFEGEDIVVSLHEEELHACGLVRRGGGLVSGGRGLGEDIVVSLHEEELHACAQCLDACSVSIVLLYQ